MRRWFAAVVAIAALLGVADRGAGAAPADQGNCISSRDNGGAAGTRVSSFAGPGFGHAVAGGIGGGTLGAEASDPGCRRP